MLRRLSACLLAVLAALALAAPAAMAQDAREPQIRGWTVILDQIGAALKRGDISSEELQSLRDDSLNLLSAADSFRADLKPEIDAATERVKSLQPREGATEPEPEVIVEERTKQQALLDSLTALDQQANVVALQAADFASGIADQLDARFAEQLLQRERSLLSPVLWKGVGDAAPGFGERLARLGADWLERVAAETNLPAGFFLLAAVILMIAAIVAARFILRTARGLATGESPSPARKIVSATWILILDVATPLLVLVGSRAALDIAGMQPDTMARPFNAIVQSVAIFAVVTGLARGMFAPARPAWRLIDVPDTTAAQAYSLIAAAGFVLALMPLVDHATAMTATPHGFSTAVNAVLAVLAAAMMLLTVRALMRGNAAAADAPQRRRPLWSSLLPVTGIAAIAVIVAAVAGYLALAVFLAGQIAWVWAILALMVLLLGLADIAVSAVFSADRRVGRVVTDNFALSRAVLNQIGVVVGGLARLLIIALGVLAAIAPWGLDSAGLLASVGGVLSGFQVGSITISFAGIVIGLFIFAAVILIGRVFQSWLRNSYLPTTRMDIGLKNSILTGVGYLAIILAAVLAATYAGLDLANVAIVAGALSVGIGFGLQSIVNNFVSGLILLAERPIRAGDWIAVGAEEGTVKKISVRATEIETFDRASVIVPNSNLISGIVKNMYLRDNSGRIIVTVGVGYDSDPGKVREILLGCAADHKQILHDPEPTVLFTDFGASALIFELHALLADISQGGVVRSDLRFAILERLRAAGIEIPFPQQDLGLRDWPKIEKILEGLAADGDRPGSPKE